MGPVNEGEDLPTIRDGVVVADHTHVSIPEAVQADSKEFASGSPETAQEVMYDDPEWSQPVYFGKPTRKWVARTITAVTGLAIEVLSTGPWDRADTIMAVTVVSAATLSYVLSNDSAPGGVA